MFRTKLTAPLAKGLSSLLLIGLAMPASVWANVLQDISFSALPGNRVEIVLTLAEPIENPLSFTTDNPARIAIDLPDTSSGLASKTKPIAIGAARSVVAIEGKGRTRVVVNLLDAVPHTISSHGNQLVVSISGGVGAGTASEATSATAAASVGSDSGAVSAGPGAQISGVDFQRGPDGEGIWCHPAGHAGLAPQAKGFHCQTAG